eukprot:6226548-Amphidinium_carterae.1
MSVLGASGSNLGFLFFSLTAKRFQKSEKVDLKTKRRADHPAYKASMGAVPPACKGSCRGAISVFTPARGLVSGHQPIDFSPEALSASQRRPAACQK